MERKIFKSILGVDFPSRDLVHNAQNRLQNRWWLPYYIRGVALQLCCPEVAGSHPAVGHISYIFLDTR